MFYFLKWIFNSRRTHLHLRRSTQSFLIIRLNYVSILTEWNMAAQCWWWLVRRLDRMPGILYNLSRADTLPPRVRFHIRKEALSSLHDQFLLSQWFRIKSPVKSRMYDRFYRESSHNSRSEITAKNSVVRMRTLMRSIKCWTVNVANMLARWIRFVLLSAVHS